MKIFTNDIQNQSNTVTSPDEKTPKSEKAKALNRRTKFPPTEKKNISPDQIREKLAANVEMSNTAKTAMKAQNSKQFGTGFMNDKFVPPEASKIDKPKSEEVEDELSTPTLKDHVLKSDVSTNDPNDLLPLKN